MYLKKIMLSISCLIITAGLLTASNAATLTGKLQVKVNIGSSCELKSGDKSVLDFGTLDNLNDKDHDANTDSNSGIEVQCSQGIPYKIGLNGGLHPFSKINTFSPQMSNGSELIRYYLYRDSAYTQSWGDLDTPVAIVNGTGNGATQKFSVYGRIKQQPTPVAGAYSDTITVNLGF